ncbi:MAG: hypothetical protein QGI18_05675 [Candidatus Marinimicrobia bacterium]|jgi:hypothetical protein|nr:hypothetical protein [Candidatus Neomarinimicrobiota bacterium]
MKEQKLLEMKNKVEALTRVVQELIKEIQTNASLIQGTLTAFQLHIGKKEWVKLVEKMKKQEEKLQEKKLDLDVE